MRRSLDRPVLAGPAVVVARITLLVVVAVVAGACATGGGEGRGGGSGDHGANRPADDGRPRGTASAPGTASSAPGTAAAPGPQAAGGRALVDAACAGTLVRAVGEPITDASVTEVSGVAPTADRTWVLNDSGDDARLYGVADDGSVQVVTVAGADAVDWEDLTIVGASGALPGAPSDASPGEEPHLWIADTGDNTRSRTSVQLYRVPIPAEGQAGVDAVRVEVTYPDGAHDVEAVAADPLGDGIYLLTKFEAPTLVFRVRPPAGGGTVEAEALGPIRLGGTGIATSLAIAPDRAAIAVRTYDGVWLSPLGPDSPVAEALADEGARCRAPAGAELQGEAVGFLPDGDGYVTIGEGDAPTVTTFTPPG